MAETTRMARAANRLGPYVRSPLVGIAVVAGVSRAIHSLCASFDERDGHCGLVRAANLSLDLLAWAASGVPEHRQVCVEVGLELPDHYGPLVIAANV